MPPACPAAARRRRWCRTRELLRAVLQLQQAADQGRDDSRQRLLNGAGLQRRWQHIITTESPVAERWLQF